MAETHQSAPRAGVDLSAAVWAGLIAGMVFLVMEMVLITIAAGGSAWAPPRMMAAIAMGSDVLPGPDNPPTFDLGIVLVGMAVHFVLSVALAIVLGAGLGMIGPGPGPPSPSEPHSACLSTSSTSTASRRCSRGSRMRATGSPLPVISSSGRRQAAATSPWQGIER